MGSDAARWDKRWAERPAAQPSPPDAAALAGVDVPSRGRALDLACGLGGTAVWLAQRGLTVDAFDVSSIAIEATQALAAANGVGCNAAVADLGAGHTSMVRGPYDVIVCQRFRDRSLYPALVSLLSPGGLLIMTVLSVVERENTSSPFLADPGELDDAFASLDIRFSRESAGEAHLVARRTP